MCSQSTLTNVFVKCCECVVSVLRVCGECVAKVMYPPPHMYPPPLSDVRNASYHLGKRFLKASSLNAPTSRPDTAGDVVSGILIDVIGVSSVFLVCCLCVPNDGTAGESRYSQ